jgi:mono/diheme cytochrome c family protein
MREMNVRSRVLCAVGAVLLTGLSSIVFMPVKSHSPGARTMAILTTANAESLHPGQVARGRYLVKTSGCNDCHTPRYTQSAGNVPESEWLIGDSLGWQGPWGTTYPVNLRRFMQGVTAEQWLQIARRPARPPMPWFVLRDMTDEDLTAIYEYVRSLGPAGAMAPAYAPPGQAVRTPLVRFPG